MPTRDNAALVADCVRSILSDGSRVARELIVVDNASTDGTADVLAALVDDAPFPVRLLQEPRSGSSHARNTGVAAARGEIVLFADDDVVVDDGWADALATPFADPAVVAVGGRTLPLWPASPPTWLEGPQRSRLALLDFGDRDRLLGPDEPPMGANMAVRSSSLGTKPPFDPMLGNFGDRRFGYEEMDLVDRLRRRGDVAYAAAATVRHHVRPERMTLTWLRATYFDMGAGRLRLDLRDGTAIAPALPRRLRRALRLCLQVRRLRRENDRGERTAAQTWRELEAYGWAGRHVEFLLGRFPRVTCLVRDALA